MYEVMLTITLNQFTLTFHSISIIVPSANDQGNQRTLDAHCSAFWLQQLVSLVVIYKSSLNKWFYLSIRRRLT